MDELTQKRKYASHLIQLHARNIALANHLVSTGHEVPQPLISQIREVETFAQAHYHPADVQEMMRQSNQQQVSISQKLETDYRQHQQREMTEALLDRTQEVTRGMGGFKDGLLPTELAKISKGEKITRPNPEKPKWDADKIAKSAGMTKEKFKKREEDLDHLNDIYRLRSEEEYKAALKKKGIRHEEVKAWREGGALAVGLYKRMAEHSKDEPDEVEYEPDDEAQRRASIIKATSDHEDRFFEKEQIHESYRNHTELNSDGEEVPSRTAHIAAAMEQHGY